jgi:hypothetical protein
MLDYEHFKPIRNLGLVIGFCGAFGIIMHFFLIADPQYIIFFQIFIVFLSVFYLIIGWNIVSRNRFGFMSLKLILYLLYPGFPLGYYFAKRTFKYIEHYDIETYFKRTIIRKQ